MRTYAVLPALSHVPRASIAAIAVVDVDIRGSHPVAICRTCPADRSCYHGHQAIEFWQETEPLEVDAIEAQNEAAAAAERVKVLPNGAPLDPRSKQGGGIVQDLRSDIDANYRMLRRFRQRRVHRMLQPYVSANASVCGCGREWKVAKSEPTGERVTYIGDGYVARNVEIHRLHCDCTRVMDYDDKQDATLWTHGYVTELEHLFGTLECCQESHTPFAQQHKQHLRKFERSCTAEDLALAGAFPSAYRLTAIFYTFLDLQRKGAGEQFGCRQCPRCQKFATHLVFDCSMLSFNTAKSHVCERPLTGAVNGDGQRIAGSRYADFSMGLSTRLQEFLLREGKAPVSDGRKKRKQLSADERASMDELLEKECPELAQCVRYLRELDPYLKRLEHQLILREMGSKGPSYLIALSGEDQERTWRLFRRAGKEVEPKVLTPRRHAKLKRLAPLFGDLLDWVGLRSADGLVFPSQVGGYLRRLGVHARDHAAKVAHLPDVPLKVHGGVDAPTAAEDLRNGLVTTPDLREQRADLSEGYFEQDARNLDRSGGGAEPASGFACHNSTVSADTLTPGAS